MKIKEIIKEIMWLLLNEKKYWHQNGHVVIDSDGDMRWYQNDELHREDGPAFISTAGLGWFQNDKLHREDGPAVIFPDGTMRWCINGTEITDDVERAMKSLKIKFDWKNWDKSDKIKFKLLFC